MILAALTLAATVMIAQPVPTAGQLPNTERTPNLYRPPGPGCADIERRVREDQREQLQKLGRLPLPLLEYAVLREVRGCPVPAPVGYHPSALPGAADNPPVTREGEPSNRR